MPTAALSTSSAESRIAIYYGVFFLSIGSVGPFAAVWFEYLGLSPAISGAIFAAPSIVTILFTVLLGRWADRLHDWRTAIILCSITVSGAVALLLFTQNEWVVFFVWTLSGFLLISTGPIMDAAALDLTHRRGSDYARLRAVGSAGFIVGIVAAGALYDVIGIQWLVWLMFAGALRRTGAAIALPRFRDGTADRTAPQQQAIREFLQPGILLVLFGAALINASHGFVNVFAILHWTTVGISTTMASILWTISVAAEIGLMWGFRRLAESVSARKCLLWAAIVSAIRWYATGTDPNILVLIVFSYGHRRRNSCRIKL